jgi:hypothetical protein
MDQRIRKRSTFIVVATTVASLALLSSMLTAATVSGQARALQANGSVLSDTGTLNSPTDAREASQTTGAIGALVSGEALHATTIGYSSEVASEASVGNVVVAAGNTTVTADFAMARVDAARQTETGTSDVRGLAIDGFPVAVTGAKNQRVDIPGGVVLINEQSKGGRGLAVNALHVVIDGVADVVIASASAQAQ